MAQLTFEPEPLLGNKWGFILPFGPVSAVGSLTYQDQSGNTQTLVPNVDYVADTISTPARVFPVFSRFWPITQYAPNGVTCQFTCGYGVPEFAADGYMLKNPVPPAICTAILMMVSWLYNNRDSQIVTTAAIKANPAVEALLWQYRSMRY